MTLPSHKHLHTSGTQCVYVFTCVFACVSMWLNAWVHTFCMSSLLQVCLLHLSCCFMSQLTSVSQILVLV